MMSVSRTALLILAAASPAVMFSAPSVAADGDQQFFQSVQGVWTGPGEIVAGKYKGTKFTCKLNGTTPSGKVGMTLDGSCRVGVFSQRMSATVERKGRAYRGTFLDGAGGEGLDIVSGNVDGKKVTFSISRNQLNGAMSARIPNKNSMNVSVSVRVDRQMVRVIAMDLKRVDEAPVAAVASE
jgi:hypothetical protein